MYALINTMSSNEYSIGRVISRHHKLKRAFKEDEKIQRNLGNCKNSYLPTRIVKIVKNNSREEETYIELNDDEHEDLMRLEGW